MKKQKQQKQNNLGELTLMELCDLYEEIKDKETKLKVHQLIAAQLATNQSQERQLCQAMREPLRHNKGLKKCNTRFSYVAR